MEYYPSRILPHIRWHKIDSNALRNTLCHHYVVRQKREDDGIKQVFQSKEFITGISTYLLSTQYKKRDSHWRFAQKEYGDYWDGKKDSIMPRKKVSAYRWENKQECIGINIDNLCRVRLDRNGINLEGLPDRTKELRFVINHTPTRGNFWHCDIFLVAVLHDGIKIVLDEEQKLIGKNTIKKLGQIMRDTYLKHPILVEKEKLRTHHISKSAYACVYK